MDKKWAEMTPEEKREVRMKKWIEAEDIEFASPDAKKAYQERATRLMKALLLQEPDRVPVQLPAGNYPAYYAGGSIHKVMYDYEELRRAWLGLQKYRFLRGSHEKNPSTEHPYLSSRRPCHYQRQIYQQSHFRIW